MTTIDNSNERGIATIKLAEFALRATCQLYQKVNDYSDLFVANGCAVLFEFNSNYYCFSNAHVLADNQLGKTFLLLKDNMTATVGGQIFYTRLPSSKKRIDDTLDIAVVKLNPKIAEFLKENGQHFLSYNHILTGLTLLKNQVLLLAGYPASKTKIDFKTNGLKFNPLVARTIPFLKDLKKASFPKEFHHMVEFPIKSFKETSTGARMTAPQPYGISGSGLWLFTQDRDLKIHPILVGILSEYHENRAILISTKIDLFIDLLKQKFDNTIINDGVQIELMNSDP